MSVTVRINYEDILEWVGDGLPLDQAEENAETYRAELEVGMELEISDTVKVVWAEGVQGHEIEIDDWDDEKEAADAYDMVTGELANDLTDILPY